MGRRERVSPFPSSLGGKGREEPSLFSSSASREGGGSPHLQEVRGVDEEKGSAVLRDRGGGRKGRTPISIAG